MADYTLNLGFNWNSITIGSIWSSEDDLEDYRFLQYALADGEGRPAWFQFYEDDVLKILIWDQAPTTDMRLDLAMSFGPLEAGIDRTYDPLSLMSSETATVAQRTVNGRTQDYLSFKGIVPELGATTSPWGERQRGYLAGSLSFKTRARYKLSFLVQAAASGGSTSRSYLSDPEVIVGSRGG